MIHDEVYNIFFKIIENQKITDKKAARLLGMGNHQISRYRTKKVTVPLEHLYKLLDKFGYTLIIIKKGRNKR